MISSGAHKYQPDINHLRIGDVVRIRSEEWFDQNKVSNTVTEMVRPGGLSVSSWCSFSSEMKEFCGREMTVCEISTHQWTGRRVIHLEEDQHNYLWQEYMFEGGPEVKDLKPIE